MDYSIHDAIEAGFNHVVFIIRKDIEKEFKEVNMIALLRSSHNVTVDYASKISTIFRENFRQAVQSRGERDSTCSEKAIDNLIHCDQRR